MATTSELIFPPQANHNFSRVLGDLKRSNLSVANRLRSIREDADFVAEAAAAFARPLVANERCGSWYVAPAARAASAYFKSTDGHAGQWRFSTRRLNLHLLDLIGRCDGCLVVDSTRRGKRMPDALSKTVPVWCCVLNRALFPDAGDAAAAHALYTPPSAVAPSEHAQIEARLPEHVAAFRALGLDAAALRRRLRKPLRPLWVTPESPLAPAGEVFDAFHPVVCCTSSRRVPGAEMSERGYIQGAADDTENWALGLTPPVFWRHQQLLLATPDPELPGLVRALVAAHAADASVPSPKQVSRRLFVACLPLAGPSPPPSTCVVALRPEATDPSSWVKSPRLIEVGVGKPNKIASRNLRVALPSIGDFVRRFLEPASPTAEGPDAGEDLGAGAGAGALEPRVLVACETGKDLSVGVALALLCQNFDGEGNYCPRPPSTGYTKSDIRVQLSRIMTTFPDANPSRTTLQSVNSFLMG
ncbi:initiator tRNA phosphoribosyl transferase [Durotheca rogersii]|uniref:initiator tRNA phosphoribosyl transferase n=1 Tax=Durotheca rogersii TaxID=419775 RepID=UPI00221F6B3E|nr:initiator tRNA phosphoribosyl transferase [Durotheca rogersii]KAI5862923.1 initiator tRNA phosphoribosyl transferase [Durotheca rogersii]